MSLGGKALHGQWLGKKAVILVAGGSGSGKSTFLRQLADRDLNPQISSLLPADCATWPVIEANDFFKQINRPNRSSNLRDGLEQDSIIAHYNSHFLRNGAMTSYNQDPAHQVWESAQILFVVNVQVSREQLAHQFTSRHRMAMAKKSLGSRLWSHWIRRPIRLLTGKGSGIVSSLDLVEDEAEFERWETLWRHYEHTLSTRPNCKASIWVSPADSGKLDFKQVKRPDQR